MNLIVFIGTVLWFLSGIVGMEIGASIDEAVGIKPNAKDFRGVSFGPLVLIAALLAAVKTATRRRSA